MDKWRLVAAPVHGEVKLGPEGLRTRDGHMLEWFSRLLGPKLETTVYSRAEPWPRLSLSRRKGRPLPAEWVMKSPQPFRLPSLRDRHRWWVDSLKYSGQWLADADAAVVWNPLEGARAVRAGEAPPKMVFEMLDDWLVHRAFAGFRREIEQAYRIMFEHADHVTANSEATLEVARGYGRTDAILLRNGVDPERFNLDPLFRSAHVVIGYGGKIDFRLDTDLITDVARRLPNVQLVGDVPYWDYPDKLRGWDAAWVPHRLGPNEVGGDLIKLYEFRAAGLLVCTTKVIGWERALPGVEAVEPSQMAEALGSWIDSADPHIARCAVKLPDDCTWEYKAKRVVECLGAPLGTR